MEVNLKMTANDGNINIITKESYDDIQKKLNDDAKYKYLVSKLTNSESSYILGNTRFYKSYEIDKVVLMKEIGEQIYTNMLNYYKNIKKYSDNDLKKIKVPILLSLIDKNLLARWSIKSKSKDELITLGIGSFKDELKEQIAQPLLSKLPLIGQNFRR